MRTRIPLALLAGCAVLAGCNPSPRNTAPTTAAPAATAPAVATTAAAKAKPATPKNEMSLRAFKASLPEGRHYFNLEARLGTRFLHPFNNVAWYSIELRDPGTLDSAFGYVRKGEQAPGYPADAAGLFERLKDGAWHPLTVSLETVPTTPELRSTVFRIAEVDP